MRYIVPQRFTEIALKSENNFIYRKGFIMFLQVLGVITIIVYVVFNLIVAYTHSVKEMREELIDGQCTIGKIFANVFYAPAWTLKIVRGFVVAFIK